VFVYKKNILNVRYGRWEFGHIGRLCVYG